jgi:hypothetical protein
MLYTPDTRIYLSAVPAFGSSAAAAIAIERPLLAAEAWAEAAREQIAHERRLARASAPSASVARRMLQASRALLRAPQTLPVAGE